MGLAEYEDVLKGFALLRVRPSTLSEFGFRRRGKSGWVYIAPIDGTSLECRVTISAKGVVSEKVVDLASGDEYTLYRVANATGKFVGLVREAVTLLLKRIAASCFERDVFTLAQSESCLKLSGDDGARHLNSCGRTTRSARSSAGRIPANGTP